MIKATPLTAKELVDRSWPYTPMDIADPKLRHEVIIEICARMEVERQAAIAKVRKRFADRYHRAVLLLAWVHEHIKPLVYVKYVKG